MKERKEERKKGRKEGRKKQKLNIIALAIKENQSDSIELDSMVRKE